MTTRTTSTYIPRPRTKSAVFTSTSTASSSIMSPPPFKPTPPSALLASHNSSGKMLSRSPSFSSHPGPGSTPPLPSNTSSSSTQRSTGGKLKKPGLGIRSPSSAGTKDGEEERKKPLNRKISAPLFRAEPSSDGGHEGAKREEVGAGNNASVSGTVRIGSIRRKPAPAVEEYSGSVLPRARATSGPGTVLSDSESTTGYQRKPTRTSPASGQRVSSAFASSSRNTSSLSTPRTTSPTPPPSNYSASKTPVASSSSMSSNSRTFPSMAKGSPSNSRLRTPSIATKPTSSATSVPSHQSTTNASVKSPTRPVQGQNPVVRSAPSSVRRLSQVQGFSHSSSHTSTNASSTSTSTTSGPSFPPDNELRGQPVRQPTYSTTPSSTRLRTPSLGNSSFSSKFPSTVTSTPPPTRLRTTSAKTPASTQLSNISAAIPPPTGASSSAALRGLRAPSLIPPVTSSTLTSVTSNTSSTPPRLGSVVSSPQTTVPMSSGTVTPATNSSLLFPPIDSGDESSGGSVYSQASASHKEEYPGGELKSKDSGKQGNSKSLPYMYTKVNTTGDVSHPLPTKPSVSTSDLNASRALVKSRPSGSSPSSMSSTGLHPTLSPTTSPKTPTTIPRNSLKVETRMVRARTSDSSLRPVGPRQPRSPWTPTSAPVVEHLTSMSAFTTTPTISTSPSTSTSGTSTNIKQPADSTLPATLTSNESFSSLISIYTSPAHATHAHDHYHTPSLVSTTSSLLSPSPSDGDSPDVKVSRRIAPAPNSIFGFGMFGSERSTTTDGSNGTGRGTRGRIPSFTDDSLVSDGATESEKEQQLVFGGKKDEDKDDNRMESDARREKSMSVGTVRAPYDGLGSRIRDEDGRTIGDDPGGSRAITPPSRSHPQASTEARLPSSPASTLNATPSRTSPTPVSRSLRPPLFQNLSPLKDISQPPLTSPSRASHYVSKRHSSVPQRLGTDDMKRLLSKPAVISGYSSTSDSESCGLRKPGSPGVATAGRIPPSPRKRVASDQSHLPSVRNESGFTSDVAPTPRKLVVAGSNWVAPWDEREGAGAGAGTACSSDGKGFALLGRTSSLGRKASEEFMTWKKEKEMTSSAGKKNRNVLRKPSLKALPTVGAVGTSSLRPPQSTSNSRTPSPSLSRSGNSSSRGSSPTPATNASSSSAVRTPAEEIMLAYKQQQVREQMIERDFGDGRTAGVKTGDTSTKVEGSVAKTSKETEAKSIREEVRLRNGDATTAAVKDSKSLIPASSVAPAAKAEPSTRKVEEPTLVPALQDRKREAEQTPPTPNTPSYRSPESSTGQVVAIGSEKDAFLPSFWDNPTTNLASELVIGNGDVSSSKIYRPPVSSTSVKNVSASGASRRSLQERRTSLPRPLTVLPPAPNGRISVDRNREVTSPAVAEVDLPPALRPDPSSNGSTPLPSPMGSVSKASKGGIWNLMKRISTGGLRDKYLQPSDSETSSPNTPPPPVPPLPKNLVSPKFESKLKSPTSPTTPINASISMSTKTVKARRSTGDYRSGIPASTSKAQTASTTSSSTGSNRPSTTTRSSSPVSSSFNRPGESRTSSSSYGEDVPALPSGKKPTVDKLQKHILSPSELSRLQRDFEQEYEEQKRSTTTTPPSLSKTATGSSNSVATPSGRPSEEWMIVCSPIDPPAFSLPPPRRDKRNASRSRPGTAPGPLPAPASTTSLRKTSVIVPSGHHFPSQQAMSDDGHEYGPPPSVRQSLLPQSRKSISAIPRPSESSKMPSPRSKGMVFRELPSFKRTLAEGLSEKEKADKWDDLLLRSDLAGGTLHLGGADRLDSDELRFSVAESEDGG